MEFWLPAADREIHMKINAASQLGYLRENISGLVEQCQPLWHPLGFVSCVVRDEPNLLMVRVHYWPKAERRTKSPDWPIHTHKYDLSSFVLMGSVRDMQYRTESNGSEYAIYSVSYHGENSAIAPSKREVSVVRIVDEMHCVGDEYSVPVGVFHQTFVPLDNNAMTLVALSNFQDTDALVLGNLGDKSFPYDRLPFDKISFWASVSEALMRFPRQLT